VSTLEKVLFLEFRLDLFNNPVGYRTSLGKMLRILLFLSGCCLKTEVFKQLYFYNKDKYIRSIPTQNLRHSLSALKMLRIFLFGPPNRHIQPERYVQWYLKIDCIKSIQKWSSSWSSSRRSASS
jgi:hypothetical protein